MPYQAGKHLPGERASKLGHLQVVKSALVGKLVEAFESDAAPEASQPAAWKEWTGEAEPLPIVFAVDGSHLPVASSRPPYKELMFVKTALIRLDAVRLGRIDRHSPNPFALRDLLQDAAVYHATVFPLRHVWLPHATLYDTVREIAFESMRDDLSGAALDTLRWLAYEKWTDEKKALPLFECPHCRETKATLPFDATEGTCPACHKPIYITDMLGFHQEMTEDAASQNVPSSYRSIHETLLLFAGVKYYWEHDRKTLGECLFVKDGPLSLRAQYSKLVAPIRKFLSHALAAGAPVHILGQEKTGYFVDHLQMLTNYLPCDKRVRFFTPGTDYVTTEVQRRQSGGAPYGKDTNYGAKMFLAWREHHRMVVSIPTGQFLRDPTFKDLIGADRIFATIPDILGYKHEDSLLPIELANGIASMSTYPSAQILKLFSENAGII